MTVVTRRARAGDGAAGPEPAADLRSWGRAPGEPVVHGLVVGRSLLYPPDGGVRAVGDSAARLLRAATEGEQA